MPEPLILLMILAFCFVLSVKDGIIARYEYDNNKNIIDIKIFPSYNISKDTICCFDTDGRMICTIHD